MFWLRLWILTLAEVTHALSFFLQIVLCKPMSACQHAPRRRSRQRDRKYEFFAACQAGCLKCVQQFLTQDHTLLFAESNNMKYTGLDFAQWGLKDTHDLDCEGVSQFLEELMALRANSPELLTVNAGQPPSLSEAEVYATAPVVALEPSDHFARLAKLIQWRAEGILSQDEFNMLKKGIFQSR